MRKVFVILTLATVTAMASAQELRFVQDSQPWLNGENAAGLTRLDGNRYSLAEGVFRKDNGGLTGIEASDDSYSTGLTTESYLNFSDRIVFHGGLSWSWFKGKNMGGPVFINPSFNSFNIIETSAETSGIKTRELYSLSGGIGYKVSDKVSIGGRVSYECGDQTKRKDPRILDKWMDLNIGAGFDYAVSDYFRVGADIRYRRTLEQIAGGQYGTNTTNYVLFVDYGAGLSVKELFDTDENHISTSSSRPMSNYLYGAGIQAEIGHSTKFRNELFFLRRDGYFGKKSSTSVVFEEFDGNELGYEGLLLIPSADALNKINLKASLITLVNHRNIYSKVYNSGEETKITYSNPQKSLSRSQMNLTAGYSRYDGVKEDNYRWNYGANAFLNYNNQKVTYYPLYRKQNYAIVKMEAFGERNITLSKGCLTPHAKAVLSTGFGTKANDGSYAVTASTSVVSADLWLNWQYDYEILAKGGIDLGLKYTRPLKRVKAYISLEDIFTGLLSDSAYLPGKTRNAAIITLGCSF